MEMYVYVLPVLLGYLLDLFIGDPRWMPHPIVLFGNCISKGDKFLNKGEFRLFKGAVLVIIYVIAVAVVFFYSEEFLYSMSVYAGMAFSAVFLFFGLANKSLIGEGKEVIATLEEGGLEAGRKRLSWIVGRDTSALSENQIRKAVLETISENLSDGVIAPLFYFALAGLPGIMCYKMVNTFDSMIGYKNEKYKDFGCFAAKLDDVLNFIPARLTALLIGIVNLSWRSFVFVKKYARHHSSPNAGYPESALAGVIDCQFGGPNVYHGKLIDKPYIGINPREITGDDMKVAFQTNHLSTLLFIVVVVCFQVFVLCVF